MDNTTLIGADELNDLRRQLKILSDSIDLVPQRLIIKCHDGDVAVIPEVIDGKCTMLEPAKISDVEYRVMGWSAKTVQIFVNHLQFGTKISVDMPDIYHLYRMACQYSAADVKDYTLQKLKSMATDNHHVVEVYQSVTDMPEIRDIARNHIMAAIQHPKYELKCDICSHVSNRVSMGDPHGHYTVPICNGVFKPTVVKTGINFSKLTVYERAALFDKLVENM